MSESTKIHPCADCPRCCKPVFAILLIVLGVSLLRDVILPRNDQK